MEDIIFGYKIPVYSIRNSIIENILFRYKCIKRFSIGKSLVGRDITALHIGNNKSSILLTGAYHGMEWITSLVLLKFTENICKLVSHQGYLNGVNVGEAIANRGITIIPCVNPDGVEISLIGAETAGKYSTLVETIGELKSWQANARGVDLNHNFNAGWENLRKMEIEKGIIGPSRTRYGGTCAESEPETRSIVGLCRDKNFDYAIAFHSQGEEIYWNYGDKTPDNAKEFAENIAKLSGYTVSDPQGLAVGGGFKDWFISKFYKPAFTIEIGKGKNPLPISDFDDIYNKLENALYYIAGI